VRNAIDDLGFLGQVIGIELSNLGHCFRPRYPPEGGNPPPIEGGGLKEEKRQRKRKRDKKRERARGKR